VTNCSNYQLKKSKLNELKLELKDKVSLLK